MQYDFMRQHDFVQLDGFGHCVLCFCCERLKSSSMPLGLPCTPYLTLMIIMSVTLLYSACTV